MTHECCEEVEAHLIAALVALHADHEAVGGAAPPVMSAVDWQALLQKAIDTLGPFALALVKKLLEDLIARQAKTA